jgi:hypothetical protein
MNQLLWKSNGSDLSTLECMADVSIKAGKKKVCRLQMQASANLAQHFRKTKSVWK